VLNVEINGRESANIEDVVVERFIESISRSFRSRDDKFHVSMLCYPCMRHAYFDITKGSHFDLTTTLKFWIGRQLHATPILSGNEIACEWEKIIGSCDEYESGLLIEKKTCTEIPKQPLSHHVTQLEYYSVLLKHSDHPVTKACILYIDIYKKALKAYKVTLRNVSVIEAEMLQKKRTLEAAISTGKLPPRHISWLCSWCSHCSECFKPQGK